MSAGGCPLSHQVLTYSVPNVSDVCVPAGNGTYVAQLGNPSNNYTCGARLAHAALLRACMSTCCGQCGAVWGSVYKERQTVAHSSTISTTMMFEV